jgi:hypothetical protein
MLRKTWLRSIGNQEEKLVVGMNNRCTDLPVSQRIER